MKIAIIGAGQIGLAFSKLMSIIFSSYPVEVWDKNFAWLPRDQQSMTFDADAETNESLAKRFHDGKVTHVINAMPFNYNEKVASAAFMARCHYIDFTEDDMSSDFVQEMFKGSGLNSATKCGVAPGFVNYIGHQLVAEVEFPESLLIGVGALPRNVNFSTPASSYNLTWSVDGLVNEYLRPCRVKLHGHETRVPALTGIETVIADGVIYEAAFTSGGVGSLVKELPRVSNVAYKTLRYPGHYAYVKDCVARNHGDFDRIKAEFLHVFPTTKNDVVIVYAEVTGKHHGRKVRETFSKRFAGVYGLSAIQTTTAGAGLAILELMINGTISGNITHSNMTLDTFYKTGVSGHCFKN